MAPDQIRMSAQHHRLVLYGLATITAALGVWAGIELMARGGAHSVAFQNAANLFVVSAIVTFIVRRYRPAPAAVLNVAPPTGEPASQAERASPFRRRLAAHRPSRTSGPLAPVLAQAARGADPLETHLMAQAETPGRGLRLADLRADRNHAEQTGGDVPSVTVHVERRLDPVNTVKAADGRDVELVEYEEAAGPKSDHGGARTSAPPRADVPDVNKPSPPPRRDDDSPPWAATTPYIH